MPIKSITSVEGLSCNVVLSCIQDKAGFIWIATQQGLNRYDGNSCLVFQNETNNNNSLNYNNLSDLELDSKGNLWIATLGAGINFFDLNNHRFTHFVHDPENPESLRDNSVEILFVDNMDNVWVSSTSDIGINMLRKGGHSFKQFTTEENNQNSLPGNTILCINSDKQGKIWIGTSKGLCKFISENNTFLRIQQPPEISNIYAIQPVDDHTLLVSTNDGLKHYHIDENKFEHLDILKKHDIKNFVVQFLLIDSKNNYWLGSRDKGIVFISADLTSCIHFQEDFRTKSTLLKNDVRDIFEDIEGNIWISTFGGGISYINSSLRSFNHYNYLNSYNHELSHNVILTFLQIDNNIMLGTDGGGLFRFNKKTGRFLNFPLDEETDVVLSQHIDSEGNYWIGTYSGGLIKYDLDRNTYKQFRYSGPEGYNRRSDAVYCIEEIGKQLWLGTNGGGLLIFDMEKEEYSKQYTENHDLSSSISNNYLRSIFYDDDHTIWIGHYEGISFLNLQDTSFKHLNISTLDPDYIGNSCVNNIFRDSRGFIWVATSGQGLLLIDHEKDTIQFFNTKEGHLADYVYGIEEDNHQNLWLSTNAGIIKCSVIQTNPVQLATTIFQTESGLQDNEFVIGSYYQDDQGYLYFGGRNGFNVFHPSFFKDEEILVNGVHLTNLMVFGISQQPNAPNSIIQQNINAIDELILNHRYYNFSLSFTSPYYSGFGKLRYAYKLDNLDQNWIYTDHSCTVNYNHLPAGKYYFRIKASINGIDWIERKPLTILILPPWWKIWWIQFILIILIVLFVSGIFLFRVRNLTSQKHVLEEKVNERTKQITQKNKTLSEQNQEISIQKKTVEDQKNKLELAYKELNKYRSNLEELVEKRTSELQYAKEKAEESDKLKSSFLSNLSHEIRTPLNAIIGFSSLIFEVDITDSERKSYQSMINSSGNILLNLISDIIDFSKIEARELELIYEEVNINVILKEVEDIYRIQLDAKQKSIGKELVFRVIKNPKIDTITVLIDKGRLLQIISNLVSNAIKFTIEGSIEVTVDLVDNKDMLLFKISDTGIGINKVYHESIFEKFRKIEDQNEILYEGTGLGLAITKSLVELLGGKIWLESEVGKGSAFYVKLPVSHTHLQKKPEPASASKVRIPQLKNLSLIIAEDDMSSFLYLKRLILPTGAIIHHAVNGLEVLGITKKNSEIKLILMDIKMPALNGVDTLLELQKRNYKIPVIAQTAYAFNEEIKKIKSAGFVDYLIKPIKKEQLYSVLEKHVKTIK